MYALLNDVIYEMKSLFKERNSCGMRFCLSFQMVTTRQQRNRTPVSPNREIEDIRDSGNHHYNHVDSSSIRTKKPETETTVSEGRLDRMERVIENLLNCTTRGEPARNADNVLE